MYIYFIIVKTFNRGEIMNKVIKYSMYGISLVFMLAVVIGYNVLNSPGKESSVSNFNLPVDYEYVTDIIDTRVKEVNKTTDSNILIKPYTDNSVKILKGYYDYKADNESQIGSINYYDGMYVQSTGISYGSEKEFDIVSVLDGEVTEVKNDELIGNSITIKHSDNTFSIYQSVKDITVKKGDVVKQGDKIAVVGTSNIAKDLNNHLYFELIIDENCVNPEEYYDSEL